MVGLAMGRWSERSHSVYWSISNLHKRMIDESQSMLQASMVGTLGVVASVAKPRA
jgi:hypothetical protein